MQWLTTKRISTFTNKAYEGNPAWVVIGVDRSVDEEKLVNLARELNPSSDTVFVYPEEEHADLALRFFSKSDEINFSGHGTIAAYFALEGEGLLNLEERNTLIRQKTRTGLQNLEIRMKDGKITRVTVSLPAPQFVSTSLEVKQISKFLGIAPVEIFDTNLPTGVVALSGCTDIVVPVRSCDMLLNVKPNFQLMMRYCDRFQVMGLVLYSVETIEERNTVHMRHFAPSIGIDEDSVSGAASASLGCYLVHNKVIPISEMTRIFIEQGHAMNKPGLVYVHVYTDKNKITKVAFGGQGIITFEGRVMLPPD